jgi:Fe-S-cluster containining protein
MPIPSSRTDRDARSLREALLRELKAIYAEVDALHAEWTCPASTECCHFRVTGREPYVTSIELELVTKAIAAAGGPSALGGYGKRERAGVAAVRLPLLSEPADETGRCPLLGSTGRCVVYEARPFGCRTFYCDRATPGEPVRQRDINEFVRRIQALAERHSPGGDRGRPLTRALGEAFDKRR